jgi:hypothetical protein
MIMNKWGSHDRHSQQDFNSLLDFLRAIQQRSLAEGDCAMRNYTTNFIILLKDHLAFCHPCNSCNGCNCPENRNSNEPE